MTDLFLELAEQNVRRLNRERAERETEQWRAGNRLWRAIMLSPTPAVCEALLRGQDVPTSRLDPEWVSRLGLRKPEAA
jgi:hypothetical protein